MRIVFCDDDISVMEKLEKYLRTFFADNGMAQPTYDAFTSGEELLSSEGRVDIAFLEAKRKVPICKDFYPNIIL